VGLGLRIAVPSASMLAVLAVVAVLSGCGGAGASAQSDTPSVEVSKASDETRSRRVSPRVLRGYLSAWEASRRRFVDDLGSGDDAENSFSSIPDASWEPARRAYDAAASTYRDYERRLEALAPPSALRSAHEAYLAAIRRQKARFQTLADTFGGTDPDAMERALAALQVSQMTMDLDGARWEEAVIAVCNASGTEVPEIVRLELISNGQRKTG
jgi:hypothetical protein